MLFLQYSWDWPIFSIFADVRENHWRSFRPGVPPPVGRAASASWRAWACARGSGAGRECRRAGPSSRAVHAVDRGDLHRRLDQFGERRGLTPSARAAQFPLHVNIFYRLVTGEDAQGGGVGGELVIAVVEIGVAPVVKGEEGVHLPLHFPLHFGE